MLDIQILRGFTLKRNEKVKLLFLLQEFWHFISFSCLSLSALSLSAFPLSVGQTRLVSWLFGQLFTKTCIKNMLRYFVK